MSKRPWNYGLDKNDERVASYVRTGSGHSQWRGGYKVDRKGYLHIHKANVEEQYHSMAGKDGRMLYHRYIVAKSLGRPLSQDEIVHHADENPQNNELENLLLTTRAEHVREHHKEHLIMAKQKQAALKEEELHRLNESGFVTAVQAAAISGVTHSTIRRRQLAGVLSQAKSRLNGYYLTLSELTTENPPVP